MAAAAAEEEAASASAMAHDDCVLAAACRVFDGEPVELSAKVLLLRLRPVEAIAGLHGGYWCTVIASGMDRSAAVEVLAQVEAPCAEHGACLASESASLVVERDCDDYPWHVARRRAHTTMPLHVPADGRGVLLAEPLAVRVAGARHGAPRGGARGRPPRRRRRRLARRAVRRPRSRRRHREARADSVDDAGTVRLIAVHVQ
uniref:Uncharacterized protein n=1 Tax=Oryza glumipatula TaxID=40148 RepID=A0A0E0BQ70_9ORYZ